MNDGGAATGNGGGSTATASAGNGGSGGGHGPVHGQLAESVQHGLAQPAGAHVQQPGPQHMTGPRKEGSVMWLPRCVTSQLLSLHVCVAVCWLCVPVIALHWAQHRVAEALCAVREKRLINMMKVAFESWNSHLRARR